MMGALATAPLFAQTPADPALREGRLIWLHLKESRQEIARLLGPPALTADFGKDFQSWQYRIGDGDHDDSSHILIFRKSTGALVSVTRNFSPERTVDEFFPPAQWQTYSSEFNGVRYSVRVRILPEGKLLLAMGTAKAGQPTGQLILVSDTELPNLFPWIAEQRKK